MNSKNTKKQLEAYQMRITEYENIIDNIALIQANKDDKKAVELLLELQKIEFEGRMDRGKTELAMLKKKYVAEFENDSAEANQEIDNLINKITPFVGKEPIGVTMHVKPLLDAYAAEKENITQERRNDIYSELKGHYMFLTQKVK